MRPWVALLVVALGGSGGRSWGCPPEANRPVERARSACIDAPRSGAAIGPWDVKLFPGTVVPGATGQARLVYAASPFGVALTADGRARYDIQVTASGLPAPSKLGHYTTYVAWQASPDLAHWTRLGTVTNGKTTVGAADLNKFLFVVTAEASSVPDTHHGPTVLHGSSPSAWLQNFMTHPMFRGNAQ